MLVKPVGMEMDSKALQPQKALPPKVVTVSGIFTVLSAVQLENNPDDNLVIASGKVTEDNWVQEAKAYVPISWILLGRTRFESLPQSWKASLPIFVTLLGIDTDDSLLQK